jgi:hypothetical protein
MAKSAKRSQEPPIIDNHLPPSTIRAVEALTKAAIEADKAASKAKKAALDLIAAEPSNNTTTALKCSLPGAIQAAAPDPPVFLGDGRYQVGELVICLNRTQAKVLKALVELRGATLDKLRTQTGVDNPSSVLKTICDRYP